MDEQKGMGGGMHLHCCLAPLLTHLAWIWGVLSLIFAFVAQEGTFWGMGAAGWMWSGLVAGVLAMGRLKKPGMCKMACEEKGKCC